MHACTIYAALLLVAHDPIKVSGRQKNMLVACSCKVTAWIRLAGVQAGRLELPHRCVQKLAEFLPCMGAGNQLNLLDSAMHPGNDQPMP